MTLVPKEKKCRGYVVHLSVWVPFDPSLERDIRSCVVWCVVTGHRFPTVGRVLASRCCRQAFPPLQWLEISLGKRKVPLMQRK